jgi:E3 ubiquitin-protein ligase SHPRH
MEEITRHAPTLKVLTYDGWGKVPVPITKADVERKRQELAKKKAKSKKAQPEDQPELVDWCTYIQGYDVCITTYQTLRSDLHFARPVPKRPRREDVVYSNVDRSRSPLVMCEWYRVVMDEVQMVKGQKTEYVLFFGVSEMFLLIVT